MVRKRMGIVVLAALAVAGVSRQKHPGEAAFAAAVDEATLRKDVRDLVAFGPRMGGTPSNERSAAYLAAYFKNLGLDVEVTDDPPALAHWEDSWRVELDAGGVVESAYPMGFSPAIAAPSKGPLILVPNLRTATPVAAWRASILYTPADVDGAAYDAVVKSGFLPRAILTSAPNLPTRYVDWSRLGALPSRPNNPVPAFTVSYVDGRMLAAAAAAGRSVAVRLASTVREGRGKTVVATVRGADRDKYYLVCAHGDSDSGGPGADDNASGVATVMEMARVYATLIKSGAVKAPRYSIRFAVWASEYHSTRAYIDREGARLSNLLGVMNFDETGTGAERDAIYFESNDVPWNEPLLRTFEQVAGEYANQAGFWTEYTTNPSQGGTDSYAFLPRKYQGTGYTTLEIPATTIYTAAWDHLADLKQTAGWESKGTADPQNLKIDYSLYYHSSADTPDNTTEREPQNMVRAVKATGIVLLRMAF